MIAAGALLLAGCNSSSSGTDAYNVVQQAFFLNSGTQNGANGTISVYDEDAGTLTLDQYSVTNTDGVNANIEDAAISYNQGAIYVLTSHPARIISAAAIKVNNVTPKINLLKKIADVTDGLTNPQCATLSSSTTTTTYVYMYVTDLGAPVTDVSGNTTYPNSYMAVYNVSSLTPVLLKKYNVGTAAHGIVYNNGMIFIATEEGIAVYTDDGSGACTKAGVYKNSDFTGRVYNLAIIDSYKICAACQTKGVYTFSTENFETIKNYNFTTGTNPCLSTDNTTSAETVFFSNNGASSGEACAGSLLTGTVTSLYKGKNITGINRNPDTKYTFVFDAGDYSAGATVLMLDSSYATAKTMTGGFGGKKALFISYYDYKE